MEILKVTDESFRAYGKVLEGYEFTKLLKAMEHTPIPADDVVYVPGVELLEAVEVAGDLKKRQYGGLPIQVGYCNGNNRRLNALEYHRSSEVDIAVTDLVILVGRQQDIAEGYTYDTGKVRAFYVPAGTGVELYATTLHYAPCTAHGKGFQCVIVLPEGTNLDLPYQAGENGEDVLLTAVNKWLIAHEEAGIEGAFAGLKGENITLTEEDFR